MISSSQTPPNAPLDAIPDALQTQPGLYKHYKGRHYDVLGTVRHSETLESMTLYRALYGEYGLWVRPAAMFLETVVIEGITQARFEYIKPTEHTGSPQI